MRFRYQVKEGRHEEVCAATVTGAEQAAGVTRRYLEVQVGSRWYPVTAGSRAWLGDLPEVDDFGDRYTGVMLDAKSKQGPWGNMTLGSWLEHGYDRLGTGLGQCYLWEGGRWLKVCG